jgi:hypothetical protein
MRIQTETVQFKADQKLIGLKLCGFRIQDTHSPLEESVHLIEFYPFKLLVKVSFLQPSGAPRHRIF